MSIGYKYDPSLNLIRTTVIGALTANKILEGNEFKGGVIEIVDMTSVIDFVAKFSDGPKLNDVLSKWRDHGHAISIFYTPNQLSADVTEFMLPLVRHAGLSVHTAKTEQRISDLITIIRSEKEGDSNA